MIIISNMANLSFSYIFRKRGRFMQIIPFLIYYYKTIYWESIAPLMDQGKLYTPYLIRIFW